MIDFEVQSCSIMKVDSFLESKSIFFVSSRRGIDDITRGEGVQPQLDICWGCIFVNLWRSAITRGSTRAWLYLRLHNKE